MSSSKHARDPLEPEDPPAKRVAAPDPLEWAEAWRKQLNQVWPNRRADLDARQRAIAEVMVATDGGENRYLGYGKKPYDQLPQVAKDFLDRAVYEKSGLLTAISVANIAWAKRLGFDPPAGTTDEAAALALFDVPLQQWPGLKRTPIIARAKVCALKCSAAMSTFCDFAVQHHRDTAAAADAPVAPLDEASVRAEARLEHQREAEQRLKRIEEEVREYRAKLEARRWDAVDSLEKTEDRALWRARHNRETAVKEAESARRGAAAPLFKELPPKTQP